MNDWVSVIDRLPERGTPVLTWNGRKMRTCVWRIHAWMDCHTNQQPLPHVTHWTPLPPPPPLPSFPWGRL